MGLKFTLGALRPPPMDARSENIYFIPKASNLSYLIAFLI